MLQKFLRRLVRRSHYWRDVGFDELSELYTSLMMRSLAMSLSGIFIPIYLYQLDYQVWEILLVFATMFAASSALTIPTAFLIARYGPKHVIFISYIFQIIGLVGMASLAAVDIPAYWYAAIIGFGNVLFFLSFHVDFSKVKHNKRSGSEVGWMTIMDRSGAIVGPIVGGIVGFLFGAQYIFVVAMATLLVAAVPLFLTKEPVRDHQKLNFRGLKLKSIRRDTLSYVGLVVEQSTTVIVWPLFIGVVVFYNNPYIQLGVITSLAVVVSMVMAKAVGKMADDHKGRSLLRFGASSNAVLHLFRSFTTTFSFALVINFVNEAVTISYRMPYIKGMYSAADDHPGYRIVYLAIMEIFGLLSRVVFFLAAAGLAYAIGEGRLFFGIVFAFGALASLLIMTERYPALNTRKKRLWM